MYTIKNIESRYFMKNLNLYITEKFKISKNIKYKNDIETFIDSFDDEEDKKEIIHLIKKCFDELKNYCDKDNHLCYVVKPREGHEFKYMWSSNPQNIEYEIGDRTGSGSKVLFVVKKGDELPDKYEKYK